ncbi:MAG: 1-deoxy-D-xylulose-5-phosphate synthase [Acidimicrobiales bacterium]|nr:1-deoxy-D-xylulose-5-phosphate synthase [Acidimicrobiales bacterium]
MENDTRLGARASTSLDRLDLPAALRDLTFEELAQLAAEIRSVIVDSVLRHGGHLGSNLGAVELTLALHRVFSSPRDILLWDTGHQAYTHKLVTGRRAGFEVLRQEGGLSGYPSRAESEHDWVENSHASTILAYAHGLRAAVKPDRRVVAVIGDGSLTGGMAFEGLNNLGNSGADCLVVLNDNGRSYAPTASKVGPGLLRPGDKPPEFFETFGIRYLGVVDGHDLPALEEALRAAAEEHGPRLLHVLTQKGRGYPPAETDPVKRLHDTSQAKPGSYTVTFSETLLELADREQRLVAITAAMPDSTGLLPFARRFPDRFFDVGIAEQHAVTAAAGMAMGGLIPVVAIYSTFLTRAFDQVMYDVGLHRLPVIFCLDRAGITGDDGPSHHGVLDLMLLSKVPGMTVLAPSSLSELDAMLRYAVSVATGPRPGPISIRWSKTTPSLDLGPVGEACSARRVFEGDDVCIIAVGKCVEAAVTAHGLLEGCGISATVWDARCVRPLDPGMLVDAARHRFVVTVEDGVREGGVGSAIASELAELTLGMAAPPRVRVLGTPLEFIPHGKPDAILARLGLGAHGITEHVRELVRSRSLTTAGALS